MAIRCGNDTVLRGHVAMVLDGAWLATLELDAASAPSGRVTLEADGGFSLRGTVVKPGGVQDGRAHVLLAGGAGQLSARVSGAFRSAQVRDPLQAILSATGDTLASSIASSLLSLSMPFWTLGVVPAWRALRELAAFVGVGVHWRYLADGTLWMGEEAWPAAKLPTGDEVLTTFPSEGRSVIGVDAPSLLPGVDLAGVGRVTGIDHWIEPESVRTWAWT